MVHGAWLNAHGSCLKAHGSLPTKHLARGPPGRGPLRQIVSWPWAMSLEAWSMNLEPWAINHEPFIIDELMIFSILCYRYYDFLHISKMCLTVWDLQINILKHASISFYMSKVFGCTYSRVPRGSQIQKAWNLEVLVFPVIKQESYKTNTDHHNFF